MHDNILRITEIVFCIQKYLYSIFKTFSIEYEAWLNVLLVLSFKGAISEYTGPSQLFSRISYIQVLILVRLLQSHIIAKLDFFLNFLTHFPVNDIIRKCVKIACIHTKRHSLKLDSV